MSTTIDQKVVEMRFDNKQFENGIQTSLSSIDKLKQGLKFDGAAKGLENIGAVARGVNFSGLSGAIDTVGLKFNGLYTIADQALRNITDSAVNAGRRIVSALTIEPIKTGFSEYETQINAVQTILANTSHAGTDLADVNAALDELNTYADKTIYNFTEMTRNVGTFTAAGLGLQESTEAIKGIANLAAVSGSTSTQASTAMYQLSQALANGTVNLQDWNSVVNAGMGGKVFQDALVRTAAAMQGVTEETFRANNITGSFRESISSKDGTAWLSAEVLSNTLRQFTGDLSDAELAAQGFTEKQIADIQAMAKNANDAATKVKTFTQLWDTLKESAQSGWTQTWEIIVGDFEEAKGLLTEISDTIGGILNGSAQKRNEVLSGGLSTGWKQLLGKGINDEEAYIDVVKSVAKEHGVAVDDMIKGDMTFQDTLKEGWLSADILSESIGQYAEKLRGMSASELEAAGYTAEHVKQIEALASSADMGSISLEELADKIARPSGRENLIESLWNAFEGLMSVIKPIKEAFSEIFPPMTADQLYAFTEGLRDLTAKFKLSDDQSKMLKSTFKGLFSILDIGVTFIKEVVGGVLDLIGNFSGLGTGILSATGSLGDWLTGLRDSVKETGIFEKGVGKVVDVLQRAIDKIKEFVPVIKDFMSRLKEKFVTPGWEGFINLLKGVWDIIQKIGGKIAEVGGAIGDALANAFRSGDISAGLDVINGGLLASIFLGVKDFIGNVGDAFEDVGGFLDGVKGILDGVKGSLEAWQQSIKANILLKIAGAIGILTASLVVLAMIDPEKLYTSLGAITALFGDLMGSLGIFTKLSGSLSGVGVAAGAMVGMAVAVLILSAAMKVVSTLDFEQICTGLFALGGSLLILVGTLKLMNGAGAGAGALLVAALALLALAPALKILSSMSWDEVARGLVALGGAMLALALGLNLMKTTLPGSAALLVASVALLALAPALKILSSMSWDEVGRGLTALGGAMLALAIGLNLMKTTLPGSAALLVASVALLALAPALNMLSGMSWDGVARGLVALGGAMLALALGLNLMNGTLGGSAALLVASLSLLALAPALTMLGTLGWDEVARGLVALGGSLLILAAGLTLMSGTVVGSAALLVASVALLALAPALTMLGGLSLTEIGKGLLAIAGVFAVMGVAGLLLAPITPIILALSAAVVLLGVGCAAIAASVALLVASLTALATVGVTGATAIVAALTIIVTGVAGLIPVVVQRIGEAIVVFCQAITNAAPAIMEAVTAILLALISCLNTAIPPLVECVVTLIDSILRTIADHLPSIIQSGMDIIIALLQGIRDNIGEVVATAIEIVLEFINGIMSQIGPIIDCAFNVIISFIDGLANAIRNNTDRLLEAINNLFDAVIEAAIKVLTNSINRLLYWGKRIMSSGVIQGIKDKISAAKDAVRDLINKCVDKVKEKISSFTSAGKDVIDGFVQGIKDKISAVGDAASEIGEKALNSIKDFLGINSPSREFAEIGRFSSEGLIKGMEALSGKVANTAKHVGGSALDSMRSAISGIADFVNSDMDSQPTIRPVLDLSNVRAGVGRMNGMFGLTPSIGVLSNVGSISQMMSNRQNGGNDDVIAAIKDLGSKLGVSSGDSYNINGITYDDGSNVHNAVRTLVRAAKIEGRI